MISQDTFRGVVVETWPVDGLKHQLIIPTMARRYEARTRVRESNLGGRMDRSLLKHFLSEAEASMRSPHLAVNMRIKCDRIERHTAEFHLESGRDYLRTHPNLKRSVAKEVKVFLRTIYLVSGTTRLAVRRTNWKETTEYHVNAEREFTFVRRVVEPMQSIMRHPYLLPMGTPTNVVFARKAKQGIIPVTESWWPEGVSPAEFIKKTNELMQADFCAMPTHKDYDIYGAIRAHTGLENPPCELKEHKTLTGQGKGIVKSLERQYSKPVFQTRSAAWIAASRYDGFDKESKELIDTWEFCFRPQVDGFFPKLATVVASHVVVPRPGDNSMWHYEFTGGDPLAYVPEAPLCSMEHSGRLELVGTHIGLDPGWRAEIARLKDIINQSQK